MAQRADSSSDAPEPGAAAVRRVAFEFAGGGERPDRRMELELDCGHVYHAVAEPTAFRRTVLERLVETGLAAIVPADGGLIGNLKVWENLVLPAAYHGDARNPELEARATRLFADFGLSGAPFENFCTALPDRLNRFERRLCAFVRAMLTEPQIMVYDSLFDGLTREATGKALEFDRSFHGQFPRGTSLHVTSDLPTLPDLGAHRTFYL